VASYQPYYLAVARYAHGNKTANLLNNQTKSGKESIDRFGLNEKQETVFDCLIISEGIYYGKME